MIEYLNLSKVDDDPKELFSYSKYFSKLGNDVHWSYLYGGKRDGKDVYYGIFTHKKTSYTFFATKEEVKPLFVSSENIDLGFEIQEQIENIFIQAKERFVIDNVKKSDDFILDIQYLFKGANNYVEFTDLNQVMIITDYQFENIKELLEFFAKFKQLKGHL